MTGSLRLCGGTLVTMDAQRRIVTGDLVVENGVITALGDVDATAELPALDVAGMVVLPGLIQGHVHFGQSLFRGLAEGRPLLDWLRERVWPLEAAHNDASTYASSMLAAADCIRSGTTTVQEIGVVRHMDAVFRALAETGMRAVAGKCLMDSGSGVPTQLLEPPDQAEAAIRAEYAQWHGYDGRIELSLCPRFILSCSTALWERVVELSSALALPIHTHLLEHANEAHEVRAQLGQDQLEYLDGLGVLDCDFRIAHGVQLGPAEAELLAGRPLRITHCPSANLKLGSGIADLGFLRATEGVTLGIGTDGAPCNNDMDVLEELRLAALLQQYRQGPGAFGAEHALELATCSGAAALGKADTLGSLEVGKAGDVVVLDLNRPASFGPCSSVYDRIVYGAGRDAVRHVAVAGKLLLRDGTLQTLDERNVLADAEQACRSLVQRAELSN